MRNPVVLTYATGALGAVCAGALTIQVASVYGTYLAALGAGMCLSGAALARRRARRVALGVVACALCAAALWHAAQITAPEAQHALPHIPANTPAQRI